VLLAAVLVLLAGCGRPSRPTRADTPLRLGLVANTLGWGTSVGREQDLARRAGAGWLREELAWSIAEPRRGVRNWHAFDGLMTAAARRHLSVLPLLTETPRWAQTPNRQLPTAAAAYGAYVHDVVARYGRDGTFWRAHPELDGGLAPRWFELWNEPYFVGAIGGRLAATRYAALAWAGLEGGRRAGRDARFLLAVDTSTSWRSGAPERWLEHLDRARPGLLTRVDGVAVHPYDIGLGLGMNSLDELTTALRAHGRSLPIWITEIGWSTCGEPDGCVSEARQADNLSRFLETIRRTYARRVQAVFVYRLRDLVVPQAARREGDFGLVHVDGRPKPAWSAFRRFAADLVRQ
jgi:polysaccharide biosynthesis protein PslG